MPQVRCRDEAESCSQAAYDEIAVHRAMCFELHSVQIARQRSHHGGEGAQYPFRIKGEAQTMPHVLLAEEHQINLPNDIGLRPVRICSPKCSQHPPIGKQDDSSYHV